jgi:hypothetical protein
VIAAAAAVLETGHRTAQTRELLHQQLVLEDPRDRLLRSPRASFDPVVAIARLAWALGGSDRLADIAVYEPRAGNYSDDGLQIPGSSFGARLRDTGVDQLAAVIERLREDRETRRAAAVVWRPHDAVRASRDISCAFGMFFHVRDDTLVASTTMRSNNAVRLLPYNLFEFTMLAELVAAEVGATLGPYVHGAASLHVFAKDESYARELIKGHRAAAPGADAMPSMPSTPSPLAQARALARMEAQLQRDPWRLTHVDIDLILDDARKRLEPYWLDLYLVLVAHLLSRAGRPREAKEVAALLTARFRSAVEARLQR